MSRVKPSQRELSRQRCLAALVKLHNVWPHTMTENDAALLSIATRALEGMSFIDDGNAQHMPPRLIEGA